MEYFKTGDILRLKNNAEPGKQYDGLALLEGMYDYAKDELFEFVKYDTTDEKRRYIYLTKISTGTNTFIWPASIFELAVKICRIKADDLLSIL